MTLPNNGPHRTPQGIAGNLRRSRRLTERRKLALREARHNGALQPSFAHAIGRLMAADGLKLIAFRLHIARRLYRMGLVRFRMIAGAHLLFLTRAGRTAGDKMARGRA